MLQKRHTARQPEALVHILALQRPAGHHLGRHLLWRRAVLQPPTRFLQTLLRKGGQDGRTQFLLCRQHGGRQTGRHLDLYRRGRIKPPQQEDKAICPLLDRRVRNRSGVLQSEVHRIRQHSRLHLRRNPQTRLLLFRHRHKKHQIPYERNRFHSFPNNPAGRQPLPPI